MIVIRSLVPGGVAESDGRLIPGDRLAFVNDDNLDNCSLEMAVQALKGAPTGPVLLRVAKPLPEPLDGQLEGEEVSLHTNLLSQFNLLLKPPGSISQRSRYTKNIRLCSPKSCLKMRRVLTLCEIHPLTLGVMTPNKDKHKKLLGNKQ